MAAILVPIKRSLSRGNTSPSQNNDVIFLQGQYPVRMKTLFVICSRAFKCFGSDP